jgi:zeta-carotene desaturase
MMVVSAEKSVSAFTEPAVADRPIRDVIVIGGGLAGLAAASALSQAGMRTRVFERRPYVGGRASSYTHPATGEVIDNCQHVLLGCCTNLIDFYKRIGAERAIRWSNSMTFIEPGGRRSVLKPGLLPAPLHNTFSFLAAPMFDLRDKVAISRALERMLRRPLAEETRSFGDWLRAHKQPPRTIEHFWRPVLLSALNDELDNVSVHYASQVFHESLMKSEEGGQMGLASVPLGEIYSRAIDLICAPGGDVMLRTSAESLDYSSKSGRWQVQTTDSAFEADAVVFALPFQAMQKLLPQISGGDAQQLRQLTEKLERFESSPITGIHLWLDRVITELDHAALLDSPLQWLFQKSTIQPATRAGMEGSYVELVVSASVDMVSMSRQEILELTMRELQRFFPAMHGAQILKSVVVKEVHATFRVPPGVDAYRPSASSPWPQAFLAGDWTATGWPSTMEGAVRSGYLAAEALCRASGNPQKFLQPDLPAGGLMRFLESPARTPA